MIAKIFIVLRMLILATAVISFVLLPIMFFYIQTNERFISLLQKNGKTVNATIVEKKHETHFYGDCYSVVVVYFEKEELCRQEITQFFHKEMYDSFEVEQKTDIIYIENQQKDAILFMSLDKKNRPLTTKRTLNYILLIVGFLCLITYKILRGEE